MSDLIAFLWPAMLLLLLLAPLSIWLYVRRSRRQQQAIADLGAQALTIDPARRAIGRRRHIPPALFLIALTLLTIALARPQMTVSLPRIEGTVILAFDVSNSMMANDLEPSRIEAAKEAARSFVEEQPGTILIGVVAFGSGGLIVQPPTHERGDILRAIERLSPQGGTSLGQGIYTSLNAIAGETLAIDEAAVDEETGSIQADQLQIDDYSSSVILLLSDGENTGRPEPLQIAQVAAQAGVRIYAVGIGSEEGALLEIDGFNLITQLDEAMLQDIAAVTNGSYYRAENEDELAEIYQGVDLQLEISADLMEVTAIFAAAGLFFLLLGGVLSMFWFGRVP